MEWNETRIAELAKMWGEGFSASQVARKLGGITRSAVIGKVHRLGIADRPRPSRPRSSSSRPTVARAGVRLDASGARRKSQVLAPRTTPILTFELAPTATMLTLTEASCRWPIGHPDQAEFGFCGRIRPGKGPYCQDHGPIAFRNKAAGIKHRDVEQIVRRYVEGPPRWSPLETSSEVAQAATLAVTR